mmetsp:Transcript_29480/g.77560  ORF Transcript_29480/g.77560 Transcript_29480/m.77560 type:complete len:200 (-) Transcript_29480:4472-5071(-)
MLPQRCWMQLEQLAVERQHRVVQQFLRRRSDAFLTHLHPQTRCFHPPQWPHRLSDRLRFLNQLLSLPLLACSKEPPNQTEPHAFPRQHRCPPIRRHLPPENLVRHQQLLVMHVSWNRLPTVAHYLLYDENWMSEQLDAEQREGCHHQQTTPACAPGEHAEEATYQPFLPKQGPRLPPQCLPLSNACSRSQLQQFLRLPG